MKVKSSLFTEEEFIKAVEASSSIKESLRKLGLAASGSSYKVFHSRAKALEIDISHFSLCGSEEKPLNFQRRGLEEVLIQNSPYINTTHLKNRLIKIGFLQTCCSECGISNWNDKPLSLHLDHINGIRNDNRIENLRLLCPNCHSQTDTYAGKNIRPTNKKVKETSSCVECGCKVSSGSTRCVACNIPFSSPFKAEWPSIEQLLSMVEQTSYVAVGKKLGVSDNAVRKHIKKHTKK